MASSNGASTTVEIEQDASKIAFEEPLKMTRTKTVPTTQEKESAAPAYSEKEDVRRKGKGVDKSKGGVKDKTLDIVRPSLPPPSFHAKKNLPDGCLSQ